jgi:hypothetical protein
MPYQINLKTFTDARGNLTVIERVLPFDIKRIFYIYGVDNSVRGKHRHRCTTQAAICIVGSCCIFTKTSDGSESFALDSPDKCLILLPEDWHSMDQFSNNAILMVLASHYFDPGDYIFEPYE